ncbi:MAG TPA: hypothetical protein VF303_01710 [Candidatus Nanoarchaeia archaeon]
MSQHLRQTIIGFIWPGPIAGPLPLNLFRVLSPTLVFYIKPIPAALVMGIITAFLSIFYFRLLELTGGKEYTQILLKKLPAKAHQGIGAKGPSALFATSLAIGVFPYAIFLRLLRYSESSSEILLLAASLVSSFVWTGVFWGFVVEIIKRSASFAF